MPTPSYEERLRLRVQLRAARTSPLTVPTLLSTQKGIQAQYRKQIGRAEKEGLTVSTSRNFRANPKTIRVVKGYDITGLARVSISRNESVTL